MGFGRQRGHATRQNAWAIALRDWEIPLSADSCLCTDIAILAFQNPARDLGWPLPHHLGNYLNHNHDSRLVTRKSWRATSTTGNAASPVKP